jgi:hypothetical protein
MKNPPIGRIFHWIESILDSESYKGYPYDDEKGEYRAAEDHAHAIIFFFEMHVGHRKTSVAVPRRNMRERLVKRFRDDVGNHAGIFRCDEGVEHGRRPETYGKSPYERLVCHRPYEECHVGGNTLYTEKEICHCLGRRPI